jgi:hypothetical protein
MATSAPTRQRSLPENRGFNAIEGAQKGAEYGAARLLRDYVA